MGQTVTGPAATAGMAGRRPVEARVSDSQREARDAKIRKAVEAGALSTAQEASWRAALDRDEALVTGLLASLSRQVRAAEAVAGQANVAAWSTWTASTFPELRPS